MDDDRLLGTTTALFFIVEYGNDCGCGCKPRCKISNPVSEVDSISVESSYKKSCAFTKLAAGILP